MEVTIWAWAVAVAVVLGLVALDFLTISSRPHEVTTREAALWSTFYVGVALVAGVVVWVVYGREHGVEYYAGWMVEKSLSVDNIFVFVIILARFAVPAAYHGKVLLLGVVFALALRSVFIAVGAAALAAFDVTFVVFGLVLVYTGVQLARHRDEDPDPDEGWLVRTARRRLPLTDDFVGDRMVARVEGRRMVTPLFLVAVAVASTDLLFALDSIPAVYGVTSEAFLVFLANAFALLGLRALFFLVRGLLDRLVYLSLGLAVILVFIGVKLVLTYLSHEWPDTFPHVPTAVSLGVIVGVLAVTTVASLLRSRRDPSATAHAGVVPPPWPHRDRAARRHESAPPPGERP